MINFRKYSLNHQKPQICIGLKFQIKMHEKCMKCENKNKKKGKRVLPVFGKRNLAKRMIKNDKNLRWSQAESEREREKLRKLLKKSRSIF